MAKVEIHTLKGNYHFLFIDDVLWMWDTPEERREQQELAEKAWGDVLVAGYGLGLLQGYLLENPRVTRLMTIECEMAVVEQAVELYGRQYGDVCEGDFYEYEAALQQCWDTIIGDIWDEITPRNLALYAKFKKQARKLVSPLGQIIGWGSEFFESLLGEER